ncbi:IS1096 element passenger TnpR family protein [Sediminibacterium sp.]|uniref:IS1096 element passenger TnpR family protein n=1 Tax=Sediminibacterium sp. TaxID=1917865 RepID=UPI003F70EBA0
MAVLKFRIYLEEDDAVYRDIVIKHNQNFLDLHFAILKSFEFDSKHQATFFRSNDNWLRGREISYAKYDKPYRVEPLLMAETTIGSEIQDVNQKFIYEYDFAKGWVFLVALISVSKESNPKLTYPTVSRVEGIGPQQYGTKSLLGDKFADIEEKYDLNEATEGFGEEGEEAESEADGDDDGIGGEEQRDDFED